MLNAILLINGIDNQKRLISGDCDKWEDKIITVKKADKIEMMKIIIGALQAKAGDLCVVSGRPYQCAMSVCEDLS
ncbi:hypothetical protein ABTM39_20305, partial [Acinetobacter baumannii]